jgi:hypothetical protein
MPITVTIGRVGGVFTSTVDGFVETPTTSPGTLLNGESDLIAGIYAFNNYGSYYPFAVQATSFSASVTVVPEPAITSAFLLLGGLAMRRHRRRMA